MDLPGGLTQERQQWCWDVAEKFQREVLSHGLPIMEAVAISLTLAALLARELASNPPPGVGTAAGA